ncbi:hypothetical protein M405DRAFT_933490 [Rhizopogon salebrosus TDB-379]|nr:hypothetical protein M405DRAFT_933490 [Rhizopogon salebrosus TDB-379]
MHDPLSREEHSPDLDWWSSLLQSGGVSRPIYPPLASSGIGIGILASIPSLSSNLLVHGDSTGFPPSFDNTGVVEGWWKSRHRNRAVKIVYSAASTNSFLIYPPVSKSTLHMLQAHPTQHPTQHPTHPEVSMGPTTFFFSPSIFLTPSKNSLLTPLSHSPPPNYTTCTMGITLLLQPSSSTEYSPENKLQHGPSQHKPQKTKSLHTPSVRTDSTAVNRFDVQLLNPNSVISSTLLNYRPRLTPLPSQLRPHCLARDRLRLWIPAGDKSRQSARAPNAPNHDITDAQLERISDVIDSSWAQCTKVSYGTGLLVFHVFCDAHNVAEDKRCSVAPNLLLAFLSSCAGSYSGSALSNYAAGLKAWHLLHGRAWLIYPNELKAILDGAAALAPPLSGCPDGLPFTPAFICTIRNHLNLDTPLDAAIFACLTTTFYCIARLGEFKVDSIKKFDPSVHVLRGAVSETVDRNGLPITKFRIPRTKASPTEEETYWATQEGPSDPKAALENHFRLNPAGQETHLFAWKPPKGLRPLLKTEFLKQMVFATKASGLPDFKGHSLRTGGTLEYLFKENSFRCSQIHGKVVQCSIHSVPTTARHDTCTIPPIQSSSRTVHALHHAAGTLVKTGTVPVRALIVDEPEITRMDNIPGDGDSSLTLKGGATAVLGALRNNGISGDKVLGSAIAISPIAEVAMGGTSGDLYSSVILHLSLAIVL